MNAYEALRRSRPEWFRDDPDGIEIITDPTLVRQVRRRARAGAAWRAAGLDGLGSWWERLRAALRPVPIGVVSADRYLVHLRDPVRFPGGRTGLYNRLLPPPSSTPGVVVLPLLGPDGGVVLIEHHRHATRSRHWEVPRGFGEAGASGEENVSRELGEELGTSPTEVIPLGEVHPDTGLLAHQVKLYAVRVDRLGALEKAEGISQAITVSPAEAEDMVRTGQITDGFTIAALYRARLAGLFDEGGGGT
ncbi:NUDIX hydrolase [Streptomyces spongiae]|uniref:NUDIX hydrolase n=1 Tax=Streptomyces spongiae TaxID=565072 RepID=A0A5N8XM76_9ACTN|nr:NUDIX hydrolase [Streptomyces spongiae]MPY60196.1 NUDIX hydrolase [Streptomyces spongiae]